MKKDSLVQIIGYREYLNKTTGKTGIRQQHFANIEVSSTVSLLSNLERIVDLIPVHERYNVHYTTFNAQALSENTSLRSFDFQDMIAIDLDGIVLAKRDQYIDIVMSITKADINKTGIYCSGNGLHIVIVQKKSFDRKELNSLKPYYRELCKIINRAIFDEGLPGNADPVRLNETATLRLPLTENRKKDKEPTNAYVIQGNVEAQDFNLRNIVTIEGTAKDFQASTDTEHNPDKLAILTGCNFLKHCKENPNAISEPAWYRMIQVLAYIPEIGESLCHTYSSSALSYNEQETKTKFAQAKSFGKAATCEGIDAVWNQCSECPFYKKVKSPLQIKSDNFIETEHQGFHFISTKKDGSTSYKPDYDGLAAYFNLTHTYITDQETQIVMTYTGKKWEEIFDHAITSFATKHFVPTATNCMRSEFLGLIKNKKIASRNFIGKDNNGFINFSNGVLRLSDRVLLPHSEDFGFTYSLPYDYNALAECPNFDTLLNNITLEDQDLQKVMLEFVGYTISGRPNSWIQKVMILSGEGSNGKSTFMNIIRRLVGEDCYSSMSIGSMAKENNRYAMYGKLFNISFDEDPKALIKGGVNIFKAITAGDPVDIRRLYANPISAPINAKLIVACNKPLETTDHTHAVYRRMLIIPFKAKFEGKSDNKEIASTIDNEMSGIYNRVLDGLSRLIENRGEFSNSLAVTTSLTDYKYESAVFYRFFDDSLTTENCDSNFISIEEIMSEFKIWSSLHNEKVDISSIRLIKELKSLGKLRGHSVSRYTNGKSSKGYLGVARQDTRF